MATVKVKDAREMFLCNNLNQTISEAAYKTCVVVSAGFGSFVLIF